MRSVIVGSGRVGAGLAGTLAKLGHEVTILDVRTDAFRRLDPGFPGQALRGDGTDEATSGHVSFTSSIPRRRNDVVAAGPFRYW